MCISLGNGKYEETMYTFLQMYMLWCAKVCLLAVDPRHRQYRVCLTSSHICSSRLSGDHAHTAVGCVSPAVTFATAGVEMLRCTKADQSEAQEASASAMDRLW